MMYDAKSKLYCEVYCPCSTWLDQREREAVRVAEQDQWTHEVVPYPEPGEDRHRRVHREHQGGGRPRPRRSWRDRRRVGVGLLTDALAASTDHPFAELIDQRLLRPLGMHRTNLDRPELDQEVVVAPQNHRGGAVPYPRDHRPGAGMLASTLDDLQLLLDTLRSPRGGGAVNSGLQRSMTPQHHIREGLSIGYC